MKKYVPARKYNATEKWMHQTLVLYSRNFWNDGNVCIYAIRYNTY